VANTQNYVTVTMAIDSTARSVAQLVEAVAPTDRASYQQDTGAGIARILTLLADCSSNTPANVTVIVDSATGTKATGTVTVSGVGTPLDTLTVAGVVFTLRAASGSGTVANPDLVTDIPIGGTSAITAANILSALQRHGITNGLSTWTLSGLVITGVARTPGLWANSVVTLVKSSTALAVSGATFTTGAEATMQSAAAYVRIP